MWKRELPLPGVIISRDGIVAFFERAHLAGSLPFNIGGMTGLLYFTAGYSLHTLLVYEGCSRGRDKAHGKAYVAHQ